MPTALAAAGFDPGALTVFVAEGLSWNLPGQAVALLLDQAVGIADRVAATSPNWFISATRVP